jgi:hypothetical protein
VSAANGTPWKQESTRAGAPPASSPAATLRPPHPDAGEAPAAVAGAAARRAASVPRSPCCLSRLRVAPPQSPGTPPSTPLGRCARSPQRLIRGGTGKAGRGASEGARRDERVEHTLSAGATWGAPRQRRSGRGTMPVWRSAPQPWRVPGRSARTVLREECCYLLLPNGLVRQHVRTATQPAYPQHLHRARLHEHRRRGAL